MGQAVLGNMYEVDRREKESKRHLTKQVIFGPTEAQSDYLLDNSYSAPMRRIYVSDAEGPLETLVSSLAGCSIEEDPVASAIMSELFAQSSG